MGRPHYEMKTDRPQNMNEQQMLQLSNIHFAPYIQLATALIGKARHAGGNMFRHQMDIKDSLGRLAQALDHGRPQRDIRHERAIHDIDMDIIDTSVTYVFNILTKPGEIRSKYRRCYFCHFFTSSVIALYDSYLEAAMLPC